tara:strand:+ start:817 stop:1350 length:534 start_codon:yes stop_codon:yes gene_type:complete
MTRIIFRPDKTCAMMILDMEDKCLPHKKRWRPAYVVCANDIEYIKTIEWRILNALREANQKRIMNAPQIRHIKRRQEVRVNASKMWVCPRCNATVSRLTAAHMGARASAIIRQTMDRYRSQLEDFLVLDNAVMVAHRFVKLAVCCDACNKDVDTESAYTRRPTESPDALFEGDTMER